MGTQSDNEAAGVVAAAVTKDKDAEKVRLADAARCEVYVCFE